MQCVNKKHIDAFSPFHLLTLSFTHRGGGVLLFENKDWDKRRRWIDGKFYVNEMKY